MLPQVCIPSQGLLEAKGHGRGIGLKPHYLKNLVQLNKQTPDWKKLEVDLTPDVLSQLQDLGLNCIPLVPQCRVTSFATQSSNKA